MKTSSGTKLLSITQRENTIILASPSICFLQIVSASSLVSYCSQFPSTSIPTSKLNLSRNMFLFPPWISAGAAQNAAHIPCYVSQATVLLCSYKRGTQKYGKGPVLDALQIHRENAQIFLTLDMHSLKLLQWDIHEYGATKKFTGLWIGKFRNRSHPHQGNLGCSGRE